MYKFEKHWGRVFETWQVRQDSDNRASGTVRTCNESTCQNPGKRIIAYFVKPVQLGRGFCNFLMNAIILF